MTLARHWLPRSLDRRPARPARRPASKLSVTALEDRTNPVAIGALDPSFGGGDGISSELSATFLIKDMASLAGGKFVAVGDNGAGDFLVAQFLNDGTLDKSFGGGDGIVLGDFSVGANSSANAVAIGPDGSIYIGGNSSGNSGLAKISATGTIQSVNAAFTSEITGLVFSSATGTLLTVKTAANDFFFREYDTDLNATGETRQVNVGGNDDARNLTISPDGTTLFAVGSAFSSNDLAVVKIGAAGLSTATVATNFYALGGTVEVANDAAFSPVTGELLVAGQSNTLGDADVAVIRVNPDTLAQVGTEGIIQLAGIQAAFEVAVDRFDRPVLVGRDNVTNQPFVARFNQDLTADTNFAADGLQLYSTGTGMTTAAALYLDNATGRLTVGGSSGTVFRIATTTGLPSTVFANTTGQGQSFTLNDTLNGLSQTGTPTDLIPGFAGSVRVAQADVNGDGVLDIIAATGFGGNTVIVRDGRDLNNVLATITPFEASFTGGLFIAAGDFTGDGKADIVVSPDIGGGARVVVYSGADLTNNANPDQFYSFIGLQAGDGSLDLAFRNGLRVAVGDVNGDGVPDLVVAASNGGGPRVCVFDGKTIAGRTAGTDSSRPLANFFIYEESQRDGAFISVGDVNGDGLADIISGGGPNGGPRVRIVDAAKMLAAGLNFGLAVGADPSTLNDFFAGDQNSRGGVRVMAADLDGDGLADLVTGSGDNLPGQVFTFLGTNLANFPTGSANPTPDQGLTPFGADPLAVGVFVG